MSLTNDEVRQILRLIEESGYGDVRIEFEDFKLHVQKHINPGATAPLPLPGEESRSRNSTVVPDHPSPKSSAALQNQATVSAPVEAEQEGVVAIRSPMLGTFFRAPAPGEKPFVAEGEKVHPGDTVCLVEVMKLFNSVKVEVTGTVIKICVENGGMVEYDQVLMLIKQDTQRS